MSLNWNDLKYLLSLWRHQRMVKVAQELDSDPTTVSRRIKSLEGRLGTQLFQRVDGRYLPTDALLQALPSLELSERQIQQFQGQIQAQDSDLSGRLRFTSVHNFINYYLIERLPSFYQQYPNIELELIADSQPLDLTRHEADLAIRMGRPDQESLVAKRLCSLYYSVYANKSFIGKSKSLASIDLESLPWILFEAKYAHIPEAIWQYENYPNAKAQLYSNVGPAMLNAVKAKLGIASLPCYMTATQPELIPLLEPFNLRELWLIMHPEKRNLARVRVFIEWLEKQLQADIGIFEGK